MKSYWTSLTAVTAVAMFAAAVTTASAQNAPEKCGGADIATGSFVYSNYGSSQGTFIGTFAGTATTGFTVKAPAPAPDNAAIPNVFAGQGQHACMGEALATIGVIEVEKTADDEGQALDTAIELDVNSGLGQQIAAAFSVTPGSYLFTPGDSVAVVITVSNPGVSGGEYGDYAIKLGAKAPGAGIGVGPGFTFTLSLRPATATDSTPPVVSISSPAADEVLGVIAVVVQASDPTGPAASGVASVSAAVSSSGGAIVNLPISLVLDTTLPAAPGVIVAATGSFAPAGGSASDPRGTTESLAFTATGRSGIGSYVVNATAADVAGNVGVASKTFNVNYQIGFTKESSTRSCETGGGGSCTGQFSWTVNRSNVTSDGAPMWDKTVVAKLRRVSDGIVVASHSYGYDLDIKDYVKIEDAVYRTNFRRSDIGASGPASYRVEIYFLNVDGQLMLQATSSAVIF